MKNQAMSNELRALSYEQTGSLIAQSSQLEGFHSTIKNQQSTIPLK
jgi:hypothetical protein